MKTVLTHTTIGLYADGSYKMNGVKPEDLEDHINYNKANRWGRALFVDGKCVYEGTLCPDQIKKFQDWLISANIKADKCTAPYQ